MRLYNVIILTLAGLVVFAGAKTQAQATGNTDLSDSGDGAKGGGAASKTANIQSTGGKNDGTDNGSGVNDGSGTAGDDNNGDDGGDDSGDDSGDESGDDTGDGSGAGSGGNSGGDVSGGAGGGDSGGDDPSSGRGGGGHMPSGMMDFFKGKGPFGGWPGFGPGGHGGGGPPGPPKLRARSFRFGNDKYTGFHRRGFGGSNSHQHSARDNVQNSGPSLNSVWLASGARKINPAT